MVYYTQNGQLRREAPTQNITGTTYSNIFRDSWNRPAAYFYTSVAGTYLTNTAVTITSNLQPPTCGGNAIPGQPVLRQFEIVPTGTGPFTTYDLRLYFSPSNPNEANGNTVTSPYNLAIYHCNSSTGLWEKFTGTGGIDATTGLVYVSASVDSFTGSTFAIGLDKPVNTYADPAEVCDGHSTCYATISAALSNVANGGIVTVYAGNYGENVAVNNNVTVNVLGDITIDDLSLSSGATWNAGSSTITVNGNWTSSSGTWNAGTTGSTVIFGKDGVSTLSMSGLSGGTVDFLQSHDQR